MAITTPRGGQIKDGSVQRVDLDISTTGQAVVRKLVEGAGIGFSSTGVDAGTGDVTVTQKTDVTTHGDSNYTILTTDRYVLLTAALSTPRTWGLPAANAVQAGWTVTVVDIGGGLSPTNDLIIDAAGFDTVYPGGWADIRLSSSYSGVTLMSDGTSKWIVVSFQVYAENSGSIMVGNLNHMWAECAYTIPIAAGSAGNFFRSDGTNILSAAIGVADLPTDQNFGFTTNQTITLNDSETGGASGPWLTLSHNTTGTPAANLGVGIRFKIETSTTPDTDAGNLHCQWSSVTHLGRTSYYDFQLCNSGTPASKMRLHGSGGLSINHTTDPGAGYVSANTGFKIGANAFATGDLATEPSTGSAAAGKLGEFVEANLVTGSATSLVSGTAKTITSISLSAGDWDVTGIVLVKGAATTSFTFEAAGISLTTNTLEDPYQARNIHAAFVPNTLSPVGVIAPTRRISISGTTTVYLIGAAVFTVSTATGYGHIQARRVR